MTDLLPNAVQTPPGPSTLALACAFAGTYPDLIVSGWLPVPGPRIHRVSLIDTSGMLVPTPFQLYSEPNLNGARALESSSAPSTGRGRFTLLIDSFGVEGPAAVWLELEDGECYSFELKEHLAVSVPESTKRRLIQLFNPTAPSPGGVQAPDAGPGAGLLAASGAETPARQGPPSAWVEGSADKGILKIERAFLTESANLVLEGWLAAVRPHIQQVTLVDHDGHVTAPRFRVNTMDRPDVLGKQDLPDGVGCIGFQLVIDASTVERPRAVRFHVDDGEDYAIDLAPHLAVPVPEMQKQYFLAAFEETTAPSSPAAEAGRPEGAALVGAVDLWHRLDDQVTVATGWSWRYEPAATSVAVRTRTGEIPCRAEHLITFQRRDGDGPLLLGFIVRFPSTAGPPAALHFRDKVHGAWELPFPVQPLDRDTWVRDLAGHYAQCDRQYEFQPDQRVRADRFFGDLLTAVRTQTLRSSRVIEEDRFGTPAAHAAVSLLVPLGPYHLGLTPLQIHKLTADPFVREQDLLFLAAAGPEVPLHRSCLARFHRMYGTRARLLVVDPDADVGGMVNLGVPAAAAPHLLLLSPRVVPGNPGWLEMLLEDCRRDSAVAAVGARLVYFDGSVHHVGIGWQRDPRGGEFPVPAYPLRGLDQRLVPAPGLADVPAVSAACLLAPTAHFERLGRLDSYFLGGEFVDADYCLRARRQGYRILCDHRAVLAFADASLEGPVLLPVHNRYNALRFHGRWRQAFPEELNLSARCFNLPG